MGGLSFTRRMRGDIYHERPVSTGGNNILGSNRLGGLRCLRMPYTAIVRFFKQFFVETKQMTSRDLTIGGLLVCAGLIYKYANGTLAAPDVWTVAIPTTWTVAGLGIYNAILAAYHLRREDVRVWTDYKSPIQWVDADIHSRTKPNRWPIVVPTIALCAVFVVLATVVTALERITKPPGVVTETAATEQVTSKASSAGEIADEIVKRLPQPTPPPLPSQESAESVLRNIVILMRVPKNNETIFPAEFELTTDRELRAIQFSAYVIEVESLGVTSRRNQFFDNWYYEMVPAGGRIVVPFDIQTQAFIGGKLTPVVRATLSARMTFSMPGEVGRFFVSGEFRLVGERDQAKRWDLVKKLERRRL